MRSARFSGGHAFQKIAVEAYDDVARVVLFRLLAATLAHRVAQRAIGVQAQNARGEFFRVMRLDADTAARVIDESPHVTVDVGAGQQWSTAGHDLVHLGWHRIP